MKPTLIAGLIAVAALGGCAAGTALTSGLGGLGGTPDVPRGYDRLLSETPHGFRYSQPGEPVRRGARSERYELRSDDCSGSDCTNPRYRSEIRQDPRVTRAKVGEDIWFGWSFYNETIPSLPRDVALKPVIGQWKLSGPAPAALRLVQLGQGEGNFTRCDQTICQRTTDTRKDVVLHLQDMAAAKGWGVDQNFGYVCRLFSMEQTRGAWTDIVLATNFSDQLNGYAKVWINGELVCDYRGPVVASVVARGAKPNHRRGIFASYTERWDSRRPDAPKPTMIAYYDEFAVGDRRSDVDTLMRENGGLPPID